MAFTVTYRGPDGGLIEESLQASDRTECVAQLRARGITAISIREGQSINKGSCLKSKFNGKKGGKGTTPVKGNITRIAAWTVIALLAVGVVYWWVDLDKGLKGVVKPEIKTNLKHVGKSTKSSQMPIVKGVKEARSSTNLVTTSKVVDLFNGVEVSCRSAVTNADGTVVERIRTVDGKNHRVTKPPKRIFENASDQLIAMAIQGANSGVSMPPLPMTSSIENNFKNSLSKPIVISEDDSDEVKLVKMDVMAVRDVLKERIAQGMTVRQALEEHQDEVNKMASYNAEALKMLREIREKDGSDAANEFLLTVNKKLKEMGAREIPAPSKRKIKNDKGVER